MTYLTRPINAIYRHILNVHGDADETNTIPQPKRAYLFCMLGIMVALMWRDGFKYAIRRFKKGGRDGRT
jgi:hypothetical protein